MGIVFVCPWYMGYSKACRIFLPVERDCPCFLTREWKYSARYGREPSFFKHSSCRYSLRFVDCFASNSCFTRLRDGSVFRSLCLISSWCFFKRSRLRYSLWVLGRSWRWQRAFTFCRGFLKTVRQQWAQVVKYSCAFSGSLNSSFWGGSL